MLNMVVLSLLIIESKIISINAFCEIILLQILIGLAEGVPELFAKSVYKTKQRQ